MGKKRAATVKKETPQEQPQVEHEEYVVPQKKLDPLTLDFGREDLNNLGAKINEIIHYLNEKA